MTWLGWPRRQKDGEGYAEYMRYLDKIDDQSSILMTVGIFIVAISISLAILL